MDVDWRTFCDAPDFTFDDQGILIRLGDDRSHRVAVQVLGDEIILRAVVARQSATASIPDLSLLVWQRNRTVSLMGFLIDKRRRVVGEAWVPKPGLTVSEFQLYVRNLAIEADLFEYSLTGRDSAN